MTTRTRTRKPAAKKPAPKKTTAKTAKPGPTLVDLRHPLPVRRRPFVGPHTPTELASIRAALDAAATRLPIPVRTWNGSTAHLTDGTLLIHNPGPDRTFTAHIACPHGAIHGYPITTHTDLQDARTLTHACQRDHTTAPDVTGLDWDKAINHGVRPAPKPKTPAILQLSEGVRRAQAIAADTQPLSTQDIAAGLAARAADTETPKEHPDHE